jgi:hypothetical protein
MYDILIRAVKTFFQAFIGTLLVGLTPVITLVVQSDLTAAQTAGVALLVASVSAGLSALQNFIKSTL